MEIAHNSVFHAGEQAIQQRLGMRDRMERFGRQVVRNALPEQHREFYGQLPFVAMGHADTDGWPWASLLFGKPGFIDSPDPQSLRLKAQPLAGDPLVNSLRQGQPLGMLGIEFPTRRRNRLSGRISSASAEGIELTVDQAWGNCPQYIQTRALAMTDAVPESDSNIGLLQRFNTRARQMIQTADTFFVASYVAGDSDDVTHGVDVSHRGGRPGFVRIDDDQTLTIPDYLGNYHFNTLGNILVNPRAGLLFADFNSGDMLMLTGLAEILWDDPDTQHFDGAERLWRFRLEQGRFLPAAMPLRWSFGDYSPNTLMTGTWPEAAAQREAEATRQQWRDYHVVRIEDESDSIRSFYLEPAEGVLPVFSAGQFLTVRVKPGDEALVRTYTVSSAPADSLYRISIKREPASGGQATCESVSNYFHDSIRTGDRIEARAPAGSFTLDASVTRPAVLLSGGVGITPMVSMLRHASQEAVRTRHAREIVCVHAASRIEERPFFDELSTIAAQSGCLFRYYSALSQVTETRQQGVDYHHAGRITPEFLRAVLPEEVADIYLCGPPAFMQGMYDILREVGVRDQQINAEAFGPASLQRQLDAGSVAEMQVPMAGEAVVTFSSSGFEQAWTPAAGSLLEFAEAHGLSPAYGCRSGQCGSCKVKLLEGRVSYQYTPDAAVGDDEVLLCCCVPAEEPGKPVSRISLAV